MKGGAGITASVTVDDKVWQGIKKRIEGIKSAYTTVGVHGDAGKTSGSKLSLPHLAAIHEYGIDITVTDKMRRYLHAIGLHIKNITTVIKIPARSFERAWVDESKEKIEAYLKKLAGEIIDGKITPEVALERVGEFAVSGIKQRIIKNIPPQLHPFTVSRKGSSTALVSSGQLIGSITHKEVVKR